MSKVKINLPLRAFHADLGDEEATIKLSLIEQFDILSPSQFNQLVNHFMNPDESNDFKSMLEISDAVEINEFDKSELLVCYLGKNEHLLSDEAIEQLDISPSYHKRLFKSEYHTNLRKMLKISSSRVSPYTLPRVRAKLAVYELVARATENKTLMEKLINTSPRYLSCDLILRHFLNLRSKDNPSHFRKVLEEGQRTHKRKYSYWHIDYFYSEVWSCLLEAKKISDKKKRDRYLEEVIKLWHIPAEISKTMFSGLEKPAETVIGIMIYIGLIKSVDTFRNKIRPQIKKIKTEYPYMRACDPIVEKLMDFSARNPEYFHNHDIWGMLESFTALDLDKSEPYTIHFTQ